MKTIKIDISPALIQPGNEIRIVIGADGTPSCPQLLENNVLQDGTPSVFEFIDRLADRLAGEGRQGTAANYRCAARSLRRLCGDGNLTFDDFDSPAMRRYEAALKQHGVSLNTVSCYMRALRAVYNTAVAQGLTTDRQPFRHVYTGISTTRKRALTTDVIRRIATLRLPSGQMKLARDLFMFSFYTRGMAFVDMAYLPKDGLRDGILTYRRHKTGQTLSMKWEPRMQAIVDAHPSGDSPYLLPVIRNPRGDLRLQYKSRQNDVNRQLACLARMLRLDSPLTMYCARHSWASIAKSLGVPLAVISEALGHTSVRTTQVYLRSVDRTEIDRVNADILRRL